MPGKLKNILLASLAVLVLTRTANAEVTVRDPGTYLVDKAGIVNSADRQLLEGWLRELEQKTKVQVKVLTVSTTEGEDFFGFVQRHAELWKLGQKGKGNGVLITVAINDRQVRIHPGYGLEAVLPDSWCGQASRHVAKKYYKAGQHSEGIKQLAVAVANQIADSAGVQLGGVPAYRYHYQQRPRRRGFVCGGGLLPFIIFFVILSSMSRRRRYHGAWGGGGVLPGLFLGSMLGGMMGGGHRSGWGGGGFGGGFGGSFGGGGGFGGAGGGASW